MLRTWTGVVLAIAVLGGALPASAGVVYRFTETKEDLMTTKKAGRVEVDGTSSRVEYDVDPDDVAAYDLLLSRDGEHVTAVNRGEKTYFGLEEMKGRDGNNRQEDGSARWDIKNVKVALTPAGAGGTIAGHATEKSVLSVSFDSEHGKGASKLQAHISVEAVLWAAPDLVRRALPVDPAKLSSGAAATAAADKLLAIPGQILRQESKVTTQFAGSPANTDKLTVSIESWEDAEIPASRFVLPQGLRHQAPVIQLPGVISH